MSGGFGGGMEGGGMAKLKTVEGDELVVRQAGPGKLSVTDRKGAAHGGRDDLNPVKRELASYTNKAGLAGTRLYYWLKMHLREALAIPYDLAIVLWRRAALRREIDA